MLYNFNALFCLLRCEMKILICPSFIETTQKDTLLKQDTVSELIKEKEQVSIFCNHWLKKLAHLSYLAKLYCAVSDKNCHETAQTILCLVHLHGIVFGTYKAMDVVWHTLKPHTRFVIDSWSYQQIITIILRKPGCRTIVDLKPTYS